MDIVPQKNLFFSLDHYSSGIALIGILLFFYRGVILLFFSLLLI